MKSPEATIHLAHTHEKPSADADTLPETTKELETEITALEGDRNLNDLSLEELKRLNRLYEKLATLISPKAEPLSTTYHRPQEDGTTKPEVITIDFESSVSSFTSFYQTHHLDLPPDFKERMEDIWNRNRSAMEQAIAEKGFDTILLVPGGISLPDVHTKMTEGYVHPKTGKPTQTSEGYNFEKGGSFAGVSEDTTQDRIILVHSAKELTDHPELAKTLNKSAEEFIAQGERLTLTEYLILQRKFFDDEVRKNPDGNGKEQHLDATRRAWLPGSKAGALVVGADWHPDGGLLLVGAYDASSRNSGGGCRLSRCFV